MKPSFFARTSALGGSISRAALALVLGALLAGCGGGLVAGVGSGGSGIAEGTLSGFGSVIVDGIEYSQAALSDADSSALKLGQRLRLVFASGDAAVSVELRPQLRGPVTTGMDADGWMRVNGQWVRIIRSLGDASRSGITVVDGYASGADGSAAIATGSDAVVYGSWSWDGDKAAYVLVATRLENLALTVDPVLLGGVAVAVGASGFRLASADGTAVTAPSIPALSELAVVSLQVPRSGLVVDQGGVAAVQALDVQQAALGALDLSAYQTIRIGGLATASDTGAGTVTIQGTTLSLPAGSGGAQAGQFARASASASQGRFVVDGLQQRSGSPAGLTADDGSGALTQLKGSLTGIDWSAASVGFVLRGVTVQADAARIASDCRGFTSGQTSYVTVLGYLPSPTAPLKANSVSCESSAAASDKL